jgi:hypothetical protein
MEYWLLGYGSTCPTIASPWTGATLWSEWGGSCVADGPGAADKNGNPPPPATVGPPGTADNLGDLTLEGDANVNVAGVINNKISVSYHGGMIYAVVEPDILNLSQNNWNSSEFNVFGYASGAPRAVFNAGTSITVVNTLTMTGTAPVASCMKGGYTLETNNLRLASYPSCSVIGNDQTVFTEGLPPFVPSITLNQYTGPDGSSVSVSGTGFGTSDSSCAIVAGNGFMITDARCDITGEMCVSGWCVSNVSGSFTVSPNTPSGPHNVYVEGFPGGDESSAVTFTVP